MSERKIIKKRRYEGSSAITASFGAGIAFTMIGVISIVLRLTNVDFIGLAFWGFWMFIPGFFSFVGAFSMYLRYKRLRKEVLATIENFQNSRVNIDELSRELLMERSSLLRLLIDLRTDRYLKFRVDTKTGEIIFGESFIVPAIEPVATPITPTDMIFCPQCGTRIPADSVFCASCGASIQ